MYKPEIRLVSCLSPLSLKLTRKEREISAYFGCGKCPLCLNKLKNDWVFRLTQTHNKSTFSYFLTFTFSNENLPPIGDNGKKIFCKFLKRFRKFGTPENFKYFRISELGEKHGRLHFHAIFFNTGLSWSSLRERLLKTWPFGAIDIKSVTNGRIKYIGKYCLQNEFINKRPRFRPHWSNGKLEIYKAPQEINYFSRSMSNGIGLEFLTPAMVRYLQERGDGSFYHEGVERQLPRYYLSKVFSEEQLDQIKDERFNQLEKQYEYQKSQLSNYASALAKIHYGAPLLAPELAALYQFKGLEGKAERIRSRAKKYNFSEPPLSFSDYQLTNPKINS